MNEAKAEKKINPKTGRLAQHYTCAVCSQDFTSKDVQVDHRVPIGNDLTWDEFISRLFCEKENLQCLCIPCHKEKTLKENNENRQRRASARGGR